MPWVSSAFLFWRTRRNGFLDYGSMEMKERRLTENMGKSKLCLRGRFVRAGIVFSLAAGILCVPAYGDVNEPQSQTENVNYTAGWKQVDEKWYYYNEGGELKTGWIQAAEDGLWYYLDRETGAWNPRPELDEEASVRLLENAVGKLGYYKNEGDPLIFREDYRDKHKIYMTVRKVTGPDSNAVINSYQVERKSGNVKPAVGDRFNLYDS